MLVRNSAIGIRSSFGAIALRSSPYELNLQDIVLFYATLIMHVFYTVCMPRKRKTYNIFVYRMKVLFV